VVWTGSDGGKWGVRRRWYTSRCGLELIPRVMLSKLIQYLGRTEKSEGVCHKMPSTWSVEKSVYYIPCLIIVVPFTTHLPISPVYQVPSMEAVRASSLSQIITLTAAPFLGNLPQRQHRQHSVQPLPQRLDTVGLCSGSGKRVRRRRACRGAEDGGPPVPATNIDICGGRTKQVPPDKTFADHFIGG